MPRDYSKGKIYKIVDNTSELIYVGSTTEPTLSLRLAKHVASYKQWKNGKSRFVASYDIIKNENYTIVLLEDFPCENSDQLRAKEQYYKETIKSNNKYNPYSGLTIQEYQKNYYEENKQQLQEYQKNYYEENIEEIRKQKKQYREENKEEIQKYNKNYRDENKQKINQKHTCYCGGKYTATHKNRHLKTLKHQAYVQACLSPPPIP
jgi:hypothetical protein